MAKMGSDAKAAFNLFKFQFRDIYEAYDWEAIPLTDSFQPTMKNSQIKLAEWQFSCGKIRIKGNWTPYKFTDKLPDDLIVFGDLMLDDHIMLHELPENLKVHGSLFLERSGVTKLPDTLSVGEYIVASVRSGNDWTVPKERRFKSEYAGKTIQQIHDEEQEMYRRCAEKILEHDRKTRYGY